MTDGRTIRRTLALILIVALGALLLFGMLPFVNGLLGGFILFILFRPLHSMTVRETKISRKLSAVLMIVLSVLVILLPLSFLISVVVDQTQQVITHRDVILDAFEEIEERIPGINITERINNNLSKLGDSAANITVGIAQGLGNIGINIAIAYFLFYFLLIPEEKRFWKVTYSIIPFSKRHTRQLLQELTTVTNSAILTSGIIAVLQGLLVGLAFAIVGINSAVFWGFISALISFIPVIGTPLIWGPATIILFAQNNITGGIILLVAGLFLSTIDNFIRPIIQNRVGRIHPFAVLLGIFVGLNLFGILGFVVGPLLLMYFVLMMRMFKEEYLSE